MKKYLLVLAIAIAFALGFTVKTITLINKTQDKKTKKVTGIGGIFFKCKDPGKIKAWYKEHLGLDTDQYGTNFEWRQGADSTKKGFTPMEPF